jgi:protein-disulfide isomerase
VVAEGQATLDRPVGAEDHVRGAAGAPVTLVEYGDYECPYCRAAARVVRATAARHADNLRFVFRHFPLTELHAHAEQAAEAAEAAGAQGRFWEMHDLLMEHEDGLGEEEIASYARLAGLDPAGFARDLASGRHRRRIAEDRHSGERSGVNGTPKFYIDGVRHDGPSLQAMVQAVDAAVAGATADRG